MIAIPHTGGLRSWSKCNQFCSKVNLLKAFECCNRGTCVLASIRGYTFERARKLWATFAVIVIVGTKFTYRFFHAARAYLLYLHNRPQTLLAAIIASVAVLLSGVLLGPAILGLAKLAPS
jgi:uncharacterized membrane protein YjjP (DUF1212 family)